MKDQELICVIVKYDRYPGYLVFSGEIRDGGVWTSIGEFKPDTVIATLPHDRVIPERNRLEAIRKEYHEKESQLRVDILKRNNVEFICTEN